MCKVLKWNLLILPAASAQTQLPVLQVNAGATAEHWHSDGIGS